LAIIDFYWRFHPVFWRFFIFFGDNLWFFGDNEILLANWKITTFFSNSAPMWRAKIHKKKPAAASSCHVVILSPVIPVGGMGRLLHPAVLNQEFRGILCVHKKEQNQIWFRPMS
jgi:hypothetical protein